MVKVRLNLFVKQVRDNWVLLFFRITGRFFTTLRLTGFTTGYEDDFETETGLFTMDSIREILNALEQALRSQGQWQKVAPPRQALASNLPFCFDTLEFNQWLQWVFLPKMEMLIESDADLPFESAIHEYAEEIYKHASYDSAELLILIKEFDQAIVTMGRSS